ncbi:MAG: phosphonate metabolism transcriptional regulator PhnF [Alphaproteobacteria bacterium]
MTAGDDEAIAATEAGVSRWRRIRDTLADEIAGGRWAAGTRLPSETALARRFAVHRHTVRQALRQLAAEGRLRTEHGRGSFACPEPLRYALGERISFTANVVDQGKTASRRIDAIETIRATARLAGQLDVARGASLLRVVSTAFADGVPLARGQHHFPLERVAGIAEAVRATGGITAALEAVGVREVRRVTTRISTRPCAPEEAAALALAPRQPVLVTEGRDADGEDRPVQYVVTAFAGSRVELEVANDAGS